MTTVRYGTGATVCGDLEGCGLHVRFGVTVGTGPLSVSVCEEGANVCGNEDLVGCRIIH